MMNPSMFAVGHLALGYITGKSSLKILKSNIDIPLIFTLSILPDIDLLIPRLAHRGPTHSIITITLVSLPLLIIYRKKRETKAYFSFLNS